VRRSAGTPRRCVAPRATRTVAGRPRELRHTNVGIALGTQRHVMPGMKEEAAEKTDAGQREVLAY